MPLYGRYSAYDIIVLLKTFLRAAPEKLAHPGGAIVPLSYDSEHAIVLPPTADRRNDQLITIIDYLQANSVQAKVKETLSEEKKIILPIAEQQYILGVLQRNHWVTLVYDPRTNVASLLDSRPWFLSFLYPTKPMEQMLREGLTFIIPDETLSKMIFEVSYLNVQYNMTHCGAWTTKCILDLASDKECTPETLKETLSSADEVTMVNDHIVTGGGDPKTCLSSELDWFQTALMYLGFGTYSTVASKDLLVSSDSSLVTEEEEDGWIAVEKEKRFPAPSVKESRSLFFSRSKEFAMLKDSVEINKADQKTPPTTLLI